MQKHASISQSLEARKSIFERKFLIRIFRKLRWMYSVDKWKVLSCFERHSSNSI